MKLKDMNPFKLETYKHPAGLLICSFCWTFPLSVLGMIFSALAHHFSWLDLETCKLIMGGSIGVFLCHFFAFSMLVSDMATKEKNQSP